MELTIPRSPTISRAMAAYVVSEVTSFTGPTVGGGVCRARKSAMSRSMSIGLVFVGADRPDRLEGDLVGGAGERSLFVSVLDAEEHPFAFPPRQRRDHLAGDEARKRVLDVIVRGAEDRPLVQLIGCADIAANAGRADAGDLLPECQQLPSQCPFTVQGARRWPPREPEVESAH